MIFSEKITELLIKEQIRISQFLTMIWFQIKSFCIFPIFTEYASLKNCLNWNPSLEKTFVTISTRIAAFVFRYKEKIINIRKIIQDTPYDSVKDLAWWTEHAIRAKNMPYLRSTLIFQPWYQRCDLDIIVFLTIVAFLIVSITLHLIVKHTVYLCKQISSFQKLKTN